MHVVKVDVEGMEFEVLIGADLEQHRPWVVVVESTEPNEPVFRVFAQQNPGRRWLSVRFAAPGISEPAGVA